jgi:hypothetical protein
LAILYINISLCSDDYNDKYGGKFVECRDNAKIPPGQQTAHFDPKTKPECLSVNGEDEHASILYG